MSDVTGANGAAEAESEAGPEAWGVPMSKTVSWFDPQIALAARDTMTGIEYIRAVAEGRLPAQPIMSVIEFTFAHIAEGTVTVELIPDESLLNTNGLVHGGVLCSVMDAAMGLSSLTLQPVGEATVTVEMKVSFLKPIAADGRAFSVTGRVLRPGRRVSFAEAHAHAADGTLIGHGSATFAAVGRGAPR